jgi:hypothetical protein
MDWNVFRYTFLSVIANCDDSQFTSKNRPVINLSDKYKKWLHEASKPPMSKIKAKRVYTVHKYLNNLLGLDEPTFDCFCHVRERDEYVQTFFDWLKQQDINYE